MALAEDVGEGDHSSLACIPKEAQSRAQLIIKDDCILAGVNIAERVFLKVDPSLKFNLNVRDGNAVKIGDIAFTVEGSSQSILKGERLALNCIQRMSGIASYTHYLNSLISHTDAKLLDTRKTTPNFRMMEKWAVVIGGGHNHRYNLADMIMLKDNHIDYAGGISQAIEKTNEYITSKNLALKIEVEARDLNEVEQILQAGKVHRIMFDNFSIEDLVTGVKLVQNKFETEASGGITEQTITKVAETGVDYISVGALTHSVISKDMSLKAF